MNQSWQPYKKNNWQWRTIIWLSLIIILARPLGNWAYKILGIEQLSARTTLAMKKAGLSDMMGGASGSVLPVELVIDVKNDTPNDYTIETKIAAGHVDSIGQTFNVGEVKRFTVTPYTKISTPTARGDIVFLSGPITGENNQTCQEVHTLNYDLKYANQAKKPLHFNLSAINSKLECKSNSLRASDDE